MSYFALILFLIVLTINVNCNEEDKNKNHHLPKVDLEVDIKLSGDVNYEKEFKDTFLLKDYYRRKEFKNEISEDTKYEFGKKNDVNHHQHHVTTIRPGTSKEYDATVWDLDKPANNFGTKSEKKEVTDTFIDDEDEFGSGDSRSGSGSGSADLIKWL